MPTPPELEPAGKLRQNDLSACAMCGDPLYGEAIYFYRVKVQQFILDLGACRRAAGLEMMMGGALAAAMGPDEALAIAPEPERVLNICASCALEPNTSLGHVIDKEVS